MTGEMDLTAVLTVDERETLFAALDTDDLDAAGVLFTLAEERAGATEAGGGGNENELRRYWLSGPGGRRIRWDTGGAFARCVAEVSATGARGGLTNVKGYCAALYHDARGEWPGKSRRAGKKPAADQKIDYVRRTPRTKTKEGGAVTVADRVLEAVADTVAGRVLEARETGPDGGRVFRIEVIRAGESRNGRSYPLEVLHTAVELYEGAQVYDGHRDESTLRSSAIGGLVGYLGAVEATPAGLEADLHLLPSAGRVAEALDVALALAAGGRPAPFVGISHDVMARFSPGTTEAAAIVGVNSVDVVAVPAAGGRAVRAVAGGLALDEPELHDQTTARGRDVIDREVAARGLPARLAGAVAEALPEQFTEADLSARIDLVHTARAAVEAIPRGVGPVAGAAVTIDERDRKTSALDAFWETSPGRSTVGYRSLTEAYLDIARPKLDFLSGQDVSRMVLTDAGRYDSARSMESMDSTSWAQVLGDSVARRMIAEYAAVPQWRDWVRFTSSVSTGIDFREQRRTRFGGYGLLPTVAESAPYERLTSPPDEQATYTAVKKGGTEDLTWEMIRNDDMDAIRRIPMRLGRSAALTLYRFVFNMLSSNVTMTYDATALFHATHANTATSAALSQSALDTARKAMRRQAAYGDAEDLLSLVPRFLVVPSDLEPLAYQLSTSVVAIPGGGSEGPSDIPNLHRGLEVIVVDYFTDVNDWFLIADPQQAPTLELGFVNSSDAPELFTQSDPNQGSMFNADILTWKIRHVYSGTVIDHRGFYRGQG
ncbi:phage major capsid protein [Frankia gtarii]|uniref:phage major capsid protein n=1 Tax=Frankia gtarii TaxID=2950102 RepID=UPI0021C0FB57|nr:hypothetical protein [Frankia gtarii]